MRKSNVPITDPLNHVTPHFRLIECVSFDHYRLTPIAEKVIDPLVHLPSDPNKIHILSITTVYQLSTFICVCFTGN